MIHPSRPGPLGRILETAGIRISKGLGPLKVPILCSTATLLYRCISHTRQLGMKGSKHPR